MYEGLSTSHPFESCITAQLFYTMIHRIKFISNKFRSMSLLGVRMRNSVMPQALTYLGILRVSGSNIFYYDNYIDCILLTCIS